jgi:hypothetical protein
MKKLFTAVCLVALLMVPSVPAFGAIDNEPDGSIIVLDVLIARPLGLASIALGTGIFIISLPFTLPTGTVGTAADKLVADPFRFTFTRPVGEIQTQY